MTNCTSRLIVMFISSFFFPGRNCAVKLNTLILARCRYRRLLVNDNYLKNYSTYYLVVSVFLVSYSTRYCTCIHVQVLYRNRFIYVFCDIFYLAHVPGTIFHVQLTTRTTWLTTAHERVQLLYITYFESGFPIFLSISRRHVKSFWLAFGDEVFRILEI